MLGGFAGGVDFEQDADGWQLLVSCGSESLPLGVDGGQQALAVDAVDQRDQRERAAEFVALEVADEVPVDAAVRPAR